MVCENKQRSALIKLLADEELGVIVEIIYNLIKGVIPISKKYKVTLSTNKSNIRKVVEQSITKHLRRKRLLKISGDLPIILRAFFKHEQGAGVSPQEEI